jgi:hypothetical protein
VANKQQKSGKYKALMRSGREKGRNTACRQEKINTARKRHIAHARRSCGKYFALQLEKAYAKNPNPGTKCGKKERKKS